MLPPAHQTCIAETRSIYTKRDKVRIPFAVHPVAWESNTTQRLSASPQKGVLPPRGRLLLSSSSNDARHRPSCEGSITSLHLSRDKKREKNRKKFAKKIISTDILKTSSRIAHPHVKFSDTIILRLCPGQEKGRKSGRVHVPMYSLAACPLSVARPERRPVLWCPDRSRNQSPTTPSGGGPFARSISRPHAFVEKSIDDPSWSTTCLA